MRNIRAGFAALICLVFLPFLTALDPSEIVVIILSQSEGYNAAHANLLKSQIVDEAKILEKDPPKIVLTHEFDVKGSWTLFPLLPQLRLDYDDAKWFFFCLDNTGIRLERLIQVLSSLADEKELWVGHALYDNQPTIIHHFANHSKKFKYPNLASGFAITSSLLKSLVERYGSNSRPGEDFSIDASYEFALFVYNGGKGVRLTHVPDFCVVSGKDCATYPRLFHPCSDPVPRENIFMAVKTWNKNHADRVPVIMKTWLKHVLHYGLFTNEPDSSLPNVYVVPNTKKGHCLKTRTILEESYKVLKTKQMNWLVVVDDDTIIGMGRLRNLLSCYNPLHPVALGERYGYRVRQMVNTGYDYLTGGAGVVLSKPLVKKIIESKSCDCPSPSTPDDMFLFGVCLNFVDATLLHSPLFHQARPTDYATAYLASQEPVSFHKFWMIDPIEVYQRWFAESDHSSHSPRQHVEL